MVLEVLPVPEGWRKAGAGDRRTPGNSRARSAADAKTGESISTQDRESSEVMSREPSPAASTSSTAGISPREPGSTS